jgi:hypothetical protein
MTDKYTYRPFTRDELWDFNLVYERILVQKQAAYLLSLGSDPTKETYCVVSCWGGEPFSIGGWQQADGDATRIFAIPCQKIFSIPLTFVRIGLKWVQYLEAQPWCKRLEATTMPVEKLDPWMRALGFTFEKIMPNYLDGQDYKLWVKEGSL